MRTENDIVRLKMDLEAVIEVDLQRMADDDPNWAQLSQGYDLSTVEGRYAALRVYVEHYITRERFLRDMPSTNGPGSVELTELEVHPYASTREVNHGNDADSDASNRSQRSGSPKMAS